MMCAPSLVLMKVMVLCVHAYPTGSSGSITFTGLPADRAMPLILVIIARDASNQQLARISRPVRLGTAQKHTHTYSSINGILSL